MRNAVTIGIFALSFLDTQNRNLRSYTYKSKGASCLLGVNARYRRLYSRRPLYFH